MRKSLAAAMALLLLTGCAPVAREPDNLALVRVLGVDGGDQVTLTAVCGSDGQSSVLRGTASADTFEQARQEVVWSGKGKELSLTGVSYLLVTPGVDLEAVLFSALEDADLGVSATVWVTEYGAATLLEGCDDPAADLEMMELRGIKAPSVAQTLAALTTAGEVTLPSLMVKDGRVEKQGDVVWGTNS